MDTLTNINLIYTKNGSKFTCITINNHPASSRIEECNPVSDLCAIFNWISCGRFYGETANK
jgi:hypothetical protein